MKKALIIISLVIIFLIIYLLQTNLFLWFNLANIKPNLFVIFILVIGLFGGKSLGVTLGIFFGMSIDFFIGKSIGISAIMLGTIGFLGGYLDEKFSKDSRITMMLTITLATILYEVGTYILNILINSAQIETIYFIKVLTIEIIYNLILTIILYPLMMKFGYKIEENFKEKKILTRYF